jgi:hypothetical protein
MALIIEIKINEDTVEKYCAERVEEFENEDTTYTYKTWKLVPATYEAFTNKIARFKKDEKEPPVILRHKYKDGSSILATRVLQAFNKII